MTIGSQEEYIQYRFKRAEETLKDALLLLENQKWNATINRLYYSCFYAVIALLLKNRIESKTPACPAGRHDGVRNQFGLRFIKTGLMDKRFGKLYTKLFDYRQKGDYGDLYDFDAETVTPLINSVKEFINEIRKHL